MSKTAGIIRIPETMKNPLRAFRNVPDFSGGPEMWVFAFGNIPIFSFGDPCCRNYTVIEYNPV